MDAQQQQQQAAEQQEQNSTSGKDIRAVWQQWHLDWRCVDGQHKGKVCWLLVGIGTWHDSPHIKCLLMIGKLPS